MKRFKRLLLLLIAVFLLANIGFSQEARAQKSRVQLEPVPYRGEVRAVQQFVLNANTLLAQCHRTGQLDINAVNRLENSATSLSKSILQRGVEETEMPPIREAIKLLWLARYKCS